MRDSYLWEGERWEQTWINHAEERQIIYECIHAWDCLGRFRYMRWKQDSAMDRRRNKLVVRLLCHYTYSSVYSPVVLAFVISYYIRHIVSRFYTVCRPMCTCMLLCIQHNQFKHNVFSLQLYLGFFLLGWQPIEASIMPFRSTSRARNTGI